MKEHAGIKYCERCGQAFECKPEHITQCQCYGLSFPPGQKEEAGKLYSDCLCRNCLIELGGIETPR